MKKAIVTTTINPPTEALKKFADIAVKEGWQLIIIGDKKTPDDAYYEFVKQHEAVVYLDCKAQEDISKELSDLIGWNCIQRRNFGLIEAYNSGAEIIAVIDDDNIPYPEWGTNCRVNQEVYIDVYKTDLPAFDPVGMAFPHLWHRGFPVQWLDQREVKGSDRKKMKVKVQADFWDGDPDIDAVCRIALGPEVKFNPDLRPFSSNKPMPFNSQNTFISRDVLKDYFLFPHIGRMDDIWAAYFMQQIHPQSVVFSSASVWQERNPHDLSKDLEAEVIGYRHTKDFIEWLQSDAVDKKLLIKDGDTSVVWPDYFTKKSLEAFKVYKELLQ